MSSPIDNKRDLVRDEGGAVMIMGLAMILGLIAFLWFLLGIGETLAFRDHMQEAADSAAFTQPAVEALCMNLIVLINLIMLIMVGIYLVASVVVTVLWVGSVLCCPIPPWECCLNIPDYISAWGDRNDGASAMATAAGILSPLESIIGMAAPWAGFGLGIYAATDYKLSSMQSKPIGLPFTPMMLHLSGDLGSSTAQFGLPVTHDWLGSDCEYIMIDLASLLGPTVAKIMSYVGKGIRWYYCDDALVPKEITDGITSDTGSHDVKTGTDKDGNDITTSSQAFNPDSSSGSTSGCNTENGYDTAGGIERLIIGGGDGGHYWNCGKYGPMMNYKHGKGDGQMNPAESGHSKEYKNGADEMQSYSMLFVSGAYSDHHATHNIGFMQLHNSGWASMSEVAPSTYGYYAQAELYFDCDDKWASDSCDNIAGREIQDLTMYKFEWRSRLVKVHLPGAAGKILNFLNSVLGMVGSVRSFINGHGADQIVQLLNYIDQNLGTNLVNGIGAIADPIPGALAH